MALKLGLNCRMPKRRKDCLYRLCLLYTSGTELDIALLNDTTSICGDEVILITDNPAMNLKNDASLKYDTLGSSNIQQYALNTKISQASSVKNEMHQITVSYTHLIASV